MAKNYSKIQIGEYDPIICPNCGAELDWGNKCTGMDDRYRCLCGHMIYVEVN